jgi:hypothetical protein
MSIYININAFFLILVIGAVSLYETYSGSGDALSDLDDKMTS